MQRDLRCKLISPSWRAILVCASLGIAAGCSGSGGDNRNNTVIPPTTPPPPPPPGSLSLDQVFTQLSFNQPLAMLQAPGDDSRWFVVEKPGTVRVFDNDPAVASSDVWINFGIDVSAVGEGGLLGMAFHPDFANNGEVFMSYTAPGPFRSVVSRFTVDAGTGLPDPASEEFIISIPQPETNHNGGNIAFGADGMLYVALGDGGGGGDPFENGQDTTTLLGSILRLDVDGGTPYAIPADNPFAGNTECASGSGTADCPEIFAWGLRNPWRFSFDSQSGELWIGDVGQGAWEEIDRSTGGENFGWDEREGAHCFEPATGCDLNNVDPITEYDHSVGQSVTGGYVYRGTAFPALVGQYVFGDFVSGRIWRVPADAAQGAAPEELANTSLSISSFGEGVDGELYVVDFSGLLYRIAPP